MLRFSSTWTGASVPVPWSTLSTRTEPSTIRPSGLGQLSVAVLVWPGSRSACCSTFSSVSRCWAPGVPDGEALGAREDPDVLDLAVGHRAEVAGDDAARDAAGRCAGARGQEDRK